ncbi:hypothetical protein DFH08DRAFT_769040 [Mycena albidolilacea]|uniref:Uncharacterized protein n=1 Tax=Mycena albidolilacea TaxID=1033008 RepID=A0AAD7AHI8_9AGAR|nr:hypothetical protein DFH08DRAFT_769040 [Mycena albidolilacea]
MYATRPPSYVGPMHSFSRTPSYTVEPRPHEQRLAMNAPIRSRRRGNFLKVSKNGEIKLRLRQEDDNLELPVYGSGDSIEGLVELTRTENMSSVEIKVEGHFQLKESGYTHHTLCLDKVTLWVRDANNRVCPPSLRFSRKLPTSFQYEGRNYPLPPSHSVELKGIPGFCATIDYSVSAITHVGNTTASTPFIYCPRSRPAVPIPSPLLCADAGRFVEQPEWKLYRSVLKPSSAKARGRNIDVKFYLPASRIFCASQPIPFHLSFESDASSLAAFAPYAPATTDSNTSSGKVYPATTQVRMMRRTTADAAARHSTPDDAKAKGGIWRVDYLGEATFTRASTSPTSLAFTGHITMPGGIKAMGFAVPGLSVRDCILLTVAPPEGTRSPPFVGVREVIPVRLTTDAWTEDGRGVGAEAPVEGRSVERRSASVSPERGWELV